MRNILILGASGLVGGETLERALVDPRIARVIAPTRRPLASHSKLFNPVSPELESLLPEVAGWAFDAVLCALGTTRKKAGSQEAYRRMDYGLSLAYARAARDSGADTFALTSSKGASVSSLFFYTRLKGELERDIGSLGSQSLLFVRPSMIGGRRREVRPGEIPVLRLIQLTAPILPRGLRISRASRIAEVLLDFALHPRPGLHIAGAEILN